MKDMNLKQLLEFAGVDITKGTAKKLVEAEENATQSKFFVSQFIGGGRHCELVKRMGTYDTYNAATAAIKSAVDKLVKAGELDQGDIKVGGSQNNPSMKSPVDGVPIWEFGTDEVSFTITQGRHMTCKDAS